MATAVARRPVKKAAPPVKAAWSPVIISLNEVPSSKNVCVFGEAGVGKTVLGSTCPNVLMVIVEIGTDSAVAQGAGDVKGIVIKRLQDFLNLVVWLRSHPGEYDWICVDNITKLQELMLRDILDKVHAANRARDPDIPDVKEHQKWQLQFKKWVNQLNELPVNVLWLAHAMETEDKEGEPVIMPMLTGRNGTNDPTTMSKWFCGTVQLLGYLGVPEDRDPETDPWSNSLVITRYGPYIAKDRYDLGVPWIENPNMTEIDQMIDKKIRGKKSPATRRG